MMETPDFESVHVFEASDPRISGTWTQDIALRAFTIDEAAGQWAWVGSGAVRIENEDGAWSGLFDNFGSVGAARHRSGHDGLAGRGGRPDRSDRNGER